jgi:tetratricopeptide (TPR) repeat protein
MTSSLTVRSRHLQVVPAAARAARELPVSPEPDLEVRCHRRRRGPYTGGGQLLRHIVPDLLISDAEQVAAKSMVITAVAPELAAVVPEPPRTLTELATGAERTRFYPADRTLRLAHGIAELVTAWARSRHPGGAVIAFRELDEADVTDHEIVIVLLRRCDPTLVTVLAESSASASHPLALALASYSHLSAGRPRADREPQPGPDLAQVFIDSEGICADEVVLRAYAGLTPDERKRRHTARAQSLAALGEPTLDRGAVLYHLEHGTDPAGAGADAYLAATSSCVALGFYEAAMELALCGRRLAGARSKAYWSFTRQVSACLSTLERGEEALSYLAELRRGSADPDLHMGASYMLAMLYTRHLPAPDRDDDQALEWINNAIAIADCDPDPGRRVFFGAFMRNGKALVELHHGNPNEAMALVNEAIQITDGTLGPDEHLLHRSVLLYNRAQVLAASGEHAAALQDYDEVIRRDPDYGDYYFDRAALRRAAGQYAGALADYAAAIRLSPPSHEAHFNRADLLAELGDDDAALADLDYAVELAPSHIDSRVNRADLLLARGDLEQAGADIGYGLAQEPGNVRLLTARGLLQADSGDTEAAYESYTAALSEDPAFAAAWANRAVLLHAEGRAAEAADDLDHAIMLADTPALRANRAIALQDLGLHDRAMADLDIAVAALAAQDPDLLYQRGVSRHALGDSSGALADWRAHLAAYGPGADSPFASQIHSQAGNALTAEKVTEHGVEQQTRQIAAPSTTRNTNFRPLSAIPTPDDLT